MGWVSDGSFMDSGVMSIKLCISIPMSCELSSRGFP